MDHACRGERVETHGGTEREVALYLTIIIDLTLISRDKPVEINELRIPEPSAAYGLLWEAISGHDSATDGHLPSAQRQP